MLPLVDKQWTVPAWQQRFEHKSQCRQLVPSDKVLPVAGSLLGTKSSLQTLQVVPCPSLRWALRFCSLRICFSSASAVVVRVMESRNTFTDRTVLIILSSPFGSQSSNRLKLFDLALPSQCCKLRKVGLQVDNACRKRQNPHCSSWLLLLNHFCGRRELQSRQHLQNNAFKQNQNKAKK